MITTESLLPPTQVVVVHGDPNKYSNILPNGRWSAHDYHMLERLKIALNQIDGYTFTYLSNHDTLMDDLRALKNNKKVDFVLQLCDDGWQNHGRMELHICAFLEMLEIPYSGVGAARIGITLDKNLVLNLATSIGIPVPRTLYVEDEGKGIDFQGLKFPLFVKPNSTDSSLGITHKSVCNTEADVYAAIKTIREVFNIHGPVLIQQFLDGCDLNCVVIGNPPSHIVLPIAQEDYSALPEGLPKICGYESKWDVESVYYKNIKSVPTTLDAEKQKIISDGSSQLFHRQGLRDYARFDWRLDSNGNPHLLESNANCGWCEDGHMAKACARAGISYSNLLRMIIEAGIKRSAIKQPEYKYVALSLIREL